MQIGCHLLSLENGHRPDGDWLCSSTNSRGDAVLFAVRTSAREDGLAVGPTFVHLADCLARLGHRYHRSDFGNDVIFDDELHHVVHFGERAHNGSADIELLDEDWHQIGFGHVTRDDAVDHDDAATLGGFQTMLPSRRFRGCIGKALCNRGAAKSWGRNRRDPPHTLIRP